MRCLKPRLRQVLAFALLAALLVGIPLASHNFFYKGTWDEVEVDRHSLASYSLGRHDQGDLVRARVVVDEGSVQVLEGRVAIVQLVDSANRASMEQGEGYVPIETLEIDTGARPWYSIDHAEGSVEYTAHTHDTYYLVYRNEDWFDLTLRVADGDALHQQLQIKVVTAVVLGIVLVLWTWAYGRLFGVPVLRRLGLARGPPAYEAPTLEAESGTDLDVLEDAGTRRGTPERPQ